MENAESEPKVRKTKCKKSKKSPPEPEPVQKLIKRGQKRKIPGRSLVVETESAPTTTAQAGPSTSTASTSRPTPYVNRRRLLTTCEPEDVPAAPATASPADDTASPRYNTRSSARRRQTPPESAQQLRPPAPVARRVPPARIDRHSQPELKLTEEETDLILAIRQRRSLYPKLCALNVHGDWFFIYNPQHGDYYGQHSPRSLRDFVNWKPAGSNSGSSDRELLHHMQRGIRHALSAYLASNLTRMYLRRSRR